MKKTPFFACLLAFMIHFTLCSAQEQIRVKCSNITMTVPSSNVRCYHIDNNIPLADDAGAADLENAQIAGTSIVFSDYSSISTEIEPQATFYLVDDMTKTSFSFLDIAIRMQDDTVNIASGSADIENLYKDSSFMPYQTKERVINTLPTFLSFQNGSGIRSIVGFDEQILSSGNTSNLYYSFQGMSSDGQYYISLVLPLMSVSLNNNNATDVNWTEFDGKDFLPSLDQLDYFVRSIVIE